MDKPEALRLADQMLHYWDERGPDAEKVAAELRRLHAEVERLREVFQQSRKLLLTLKIAHYYCDDTWYSCPKHPDGCADEHRGEECDCGADEHNKTIDHLSAAIDAALKETK